MFIVTERQEMDRRRREIREKLRQEITALTLKEKLSLNLTQKLVLAQVVQFCAERGIFFVGELFMLKLIREFENDVGTDVIRETLKNFLTEFLGIPLGLNLEGTGWVPEYALNPAVRKIWALQPIEILETAGTYGRHKKKANPIFTGKWLEMRGVKNVSGLLRAAQEEGELYSLQNALRPNVRVPKNDPIIHSGMFVPENWRELKPPDAIFEAKPA